jgi:hypothetical protein
MRSHGVAVTRIGVMQEDPRRHHVGAAEPTMNQTQGLAVRFER